jgi:hypothetical protein
MKANVICDKCGKVGKGFSVSMNGTYGNLTLEPGWSKVSFGSCRNAKDTIYSSSATANLGVYVLCNECSDALKIPTNEEVRGETEDQIKELFFNLFEDELHDFVQESIAKS